MPDAHSPSVGSPQRECHRNQYHGWESQGLGHVQAKRRWSETSAITSTAHAAGKHGLEPAGDDATTDDAAAAHDATTAHDATDDATHDADADDADADATTTTTAGGIQHDADAHELWHGSAVWKVYVKVRGGENFL